MLRAANDDKNFDIKPVILSNSIEVLFEHLKGHLFSEEIPAFELPFFERMVITPNRAMEQWIQIRMASSLGITSGIKMTSLEKGAWEVRENLFAPPSKPLPCHMELFLQVEDEISKALDSDDPIWKPLIQYVNGKEKRKAALTSYVTDLFKRYGIYAGSAASDWEKRAENWQEALWGKVFSRWDYPQNIFSCLRKKEEETQNFSVHIFGFSYIHPLFFHFFLQVAHYVPVYFYQFSPCQEFWSDLSSNHPSLLGPLGKIGREMAHLIEENDVPIEENYLVFGGDTLLKRIQRGILTLQENDESVNDPSIQIHSLATPHQEIEHLHDLFLEILMKGDIEPKDILVMAPQIEIYAPYIEAIFGKQIDYQISDMPQSGVSPIETLFLILNLEKKRWSAPAVLELFDHPLFHSKMGFSSEELMQIRRWVAQTGICWGVDGLHRSELLAQNGEDDSTGTWMEGLGNLIEELAISVEPSRISFSQAELLGKVIFTIQSLYRDTRVLQKKQSLSEWSHDLQGLLEKYFVKGEEKILFFQTLESSAQWFPGKTYPFSFLERLIQKCIGFETMTINRHQLQSVRFCSMAPMRAFPTKIICLIGMNHDIFPGKDPLSKLDLLGKHPKCGYSPSPMDFDRFLFLEALLSAREKLIISYQGRNPFDHSSLPPSCTVAHLLPLISKNQIFQSTSLKFKGVSIKKRPPLSIDLKPLDLTSGEVEISITDWIRFSRSYLSHFLYHQGLKFEREEEIQDEEAFILTPWRKAALRQKALHGQNSEIWEQAKKEGGIPIGPFGKLAQMQFHKELKNLPRLKLQAVSLDPFIFKMQPNFTVTFTGCMEGIFETGLCVSGKKDWRNVVKAWPIFTLLRTHDCTKRELFFAASSEKKEAFTEDSSHDLMKILKLYLISAHQPIFLAPEWIEAILKQDPKKLTKDEHYDEILKWYLGGKAQLDGKKWVETYYPLIHEVYGAVADAWL